MKVIDLLNGIANYGEYKQEFHFKYYDRNEEEYDISLLSYEVLINKLAAGQIDLNDEVEIVEEDKKIEKITNKAFLNSPFGELVGGKFNEIIDAINEMRKDK